MSGHWFPKRTIGSLVDERLAHDGAHQALVFEDRPGRSPSLPGKSTPLAAASSLLASHPAIRSRYG